MIKVGTKGRYLGDARNQIKALILLAFSLFLFWGIATQFAAERGFPCFACHATQQQYETWQVSPHRSVSCLACHGDQGYFSFLKLELRTTKNFTSWLFRAYQDPVTGQVENGNCLTCHNRDIKGTVISKGIRVSHKEFSTYLCANCHGDVAHDMPNRARNRPDMDSCSGCHNYNEGDVTCEKCHPKKVATEQLSDKGPWKITHGPSWKATHGMGDPKTCSTCHDEFFCMGCHKSEVPHAEPWIELHPQYAKQNVEGCYQCHRKSLCTDCHRIEMPHPEGFIKQHEFKVAEVGYDLCWRCHKPDNCIPCHLSGAHPNTPGKKFKLD